MHALENINREYQPKNREFVKPKLGSGIEKQGGAQSAAGSIDPALS
jgi:hypothetical protein